MESTMGMLTSVIRSASFAVIMFWYVVRFGGQVQIYFLHILLEFYFTNP